MKFNYGQVWQKENFVIFNRYLSFRLTAYGGQKLVLPKVLPQLQSPPDLTTQLSTSTDLAQWTLLYSNVLCYAEQANHDRAVPAHFFHVPIPVLMTLLCSAQHRTGNFRREEALSLKVYEHLTPSRGHSMTVCPCR